MQLMNSFIKGFVKQASNKGLNAQQIRVLCKEANIESTIDDVLELNALVGGEDEEDKDKQIEELKKQLKASQQPKPTVTGPQYTYKHAETEVQKGMKDEAEHDVDINTRRMLVADHLKKNPHYYTKSEKCGL